MRVWCLLVLGLLGIGIHGSAMGRDVTLAFNKRLGTPLAKVSSQVLKARELARINSPMKRPMPMLNGSWMEVYIRHHGTLEQLQEGLRGRGQILAHSRFGVVYAQVDAEQLEPIAALPHIVEVGLPVYWHTRAGSVTSAADLVMRAEEMRTDFSVDGRNVRIGIISDSLTNLQTSVDSGDLPPDVVIVNGRDGSGVANIIDEGRAMAELIHDLAPGADLLFHTGIPTSLDMIAAIEALTAAGAHIIVDDLGFFGEPYFEDGPVAQAVQAAIDAGVLYVTAVGNDADANYSGMYREFDPNDGLPQNNLHDFGGGDTTMGVTIPPGGSMQVVLQWPNPFDGSANTADYDLFVFDAAGTASACQSAGISGSCDSTSSQLAAQISPIESVFVQNNTGQSVPVNVLINRFDGEALPLRMVFGGAFSLNEHNVPGRSAFGHPCVREAMSVGAIDAADPGFDTIESFSSQGPCEIYFVPANANTQAADGFRTSQAVALATPEIRQKPDVVAADGTLTSLPFFAPFFGTSAAAPHAAAVAALLMELDGGPGVGSALQILNLMRVSAVDQGELGVDDVYGFGVVDAVRAADMLQATGGVLPQATIVSPTESVVVQAGATVNFQGACSDAQGNAPLTFAWDFDGGANLASSVEQNPSVTFNLPGEFMVSLTCRNALNIASLPATLRIFVNPVDNGDGGGVTTAADTGGGGGCTLVPGASSHPLGALGHVLLPILTLCGIWIWCRWRA